MSRKEASGLLLALCQRYSGELDRFLAEIQPQTSDEDFKSIRRLVANIMGHEMHDTMVAIGKEFPDLAPSWML